MDGRQGQVTIFMIIGVLVLFIAVFFIQFVAKAHTSQLEAEREKVFGQIFQREATRIYIEDCLQDELEQGLILLGKQGRLWSDQPGGRMFFEEGKTGILYAPEERLHDFATGRIYYGISDEEYGEDLNAYPCDREENPPAFCEYSYPNTTVGFGKLNLRVNTLERDLSQFLMNKTQECVREFIYTNISRQVDIQETEPEITIDVQNDGISVKADYPLRFRFAGRESFLLSQFDFFYASKFKQLLDAAVAFPLQFDQKYVDFSYTEEQLQQPGFTVRSEKELPNCGAAGESFLCDFALHLDAYQSLGLDLQVDSQPDGDDVFIFTPALYSIVNSPYPYEFRIARQNRPPALDYVERYSCPAAEYDYLVIQTTESDPAAPADPLSEIDIELKAIDADEDEVTFEFAEFLPLHWDDGAEQTENLFRMLSQRIAQLPPMIYTLKASANDTNLADTQNVRILVDRPIETSVSLRLPYEGIASSLGNNRYVVSKEDPVFMDVHVPLDTLDRVGVEHLQFTYNDQRGGIRGFTIPAVEDFCLNLPATPRQQEGPLFCYDAESEPNLEPYADDIERGLTDSPFSQLTTSDNPGILELQYRVQYCGLEENAQDGSSRVEVIVTECIPYTNPTHPYAYNPDDENELYELEEVIQEDGTMVLERREGYNPFLATNACCRYDYTTYTVEEEKECFTNPEPGCYGQIDGLTTTPDVQGYVWETQVRLCDGLRGNICNGEFANTLYNEKLWCGTRESPAEGGTCPRVNRDRRCQDVPAFSLIEDVGWCSGRMGCQNLCEDDVAFLGSQQEFDENNGAFPTRFINEKATAMFGQQVFDGNFEGNLAFGFQCGCTADDNGKACDGNYDGWFEKVCYQGVCSERELQRAGSYRCREDDRTVEQLNEYQREWNYVTTCDEDRYCQIRDNEYSCPEIECTPSEQPKCYNALPLIAQNRFMAEATAEEDYSRFLIGLVAQCEEPGRYEEVEWFTIEGEGEEPDIPASCGNRGYDVLVNEGTEDDERWVGRGCELGDERTSEHEAKDCYAFASGEWGEGVCKQEGTRPPYCG